MKTSKASKKTILNLFLVIIFSSISSAALPLSSMGTATITNSDGTPCFSIREDSETKHGLPLHSLTIREARQPDSEEHPDSVWSFRANNHEAPPKILPKQCIRYGENPPDTTQLTLSSLELFKLYYVSISAKNDVSNVVAYTGNFCIKPAGSGKVLVHVVSKDRSLGDARFAGCRK